MTLIILIMITMILSLFNILEKMKSRSAVLNSLNTWLVLPKVSEVIRFLMPVIQIWVCLSRIVTRTRLLCLIFFWISLAHSERCVVIFLFCLPLQIIVNLVGCVVSTRTHLIICFHWVSRAYHFLRCHVRWGLSQEFILLTLHSSLEN